MKKSLEEILNLVRNEAVEPSFHDVVERTKQQAALLHAYPRPFRRFRTFFTGVIVGIILASVFFGYYQLRHDISLLRYLAASIIPASPLFSFAVTAENKKDPNSTFQVTNLQETQDSLRQPNTDRQMGNGNQMGINQNLRPSPAYLQAQEQKMEAQQQIPSSRKDYRFFRQAVNFQQALPMSWQSIALYWNLQSAQNTPQTWAEHTSLEPEQKTKEISDHSGTNSPNLPFGNEQLLKERSEGTGSLRFSNDGSSPTSFPQTNSATAAFSPSLSAKKLLDLPRKDIPDQTQRYLDKNFTPWASAPMNQTSLFAEERLFTIGVRGTTTLYSQRPQTDTLKPDKLLLENAILYGSYAVAPNTTLGVEFGYDTYYLQLQTFNQEKQLRENVELYPTLPWLVAFVRQAIPVNEQIAGFVQGGLGMTLIGPVGRGIAGVRYTPDARAEIILGIEGSAIAFPDINGIRYSPKIGLTYGVSVKF